MQNDPLVEWQRLTETYSKMYDGELLELAEDSGNLTEQAQQALSDEMRKRGLSLQRTAGTEAGFYRTTPDPMLARAAVALGADPGAPERVPDSPEAGEETDGPRDYTWKTLLCECGTAEEAQQISELLRQAGIESWMEGPGGSYSPFSQLEQGPPRILVPADRLAEARQIAAQPIPKEIVEQTETEVPEFEAPTCPKCGAGDPVLEGVDPVNSWLCEACGNEWAESGAGLEDDQEKTK